MPSCQASTRDFQPDAQAVPVSASQKLHGLVVATFLSRKQQSFVEDVLKRRSVLLAAHSWTELTLIVKKRQVGLVILNPEADGRINLDAPSSLQRRFPSVPVVAYLSVTSANFRASIQLFRATLETVVFQGIDDSAARFQTIIDSFERNAAVAQALADVEENLRDLPPCLSHVVEDLFQAPQGYFTASDLAAKAGVPVVRLYREFGKAGLTPTTTTATVLKWLAAEDKLTAGAHKSGGSSRKTWKPESNHPRSNL
jgi:hypothetical protein